MVSPNNPPLSMPPQAVAPVGQDGLFTQPWWRFLYGLYKRTAATIPYLVGVGLTATGTTQATALPLTAEWSKITTTALNTGVELKSFGTGFESTVWNLGANSLNVYPPPGCTIDALAVNAPYVLAAGKVQVFYQLSAITFRSLQLG